MQDAGSNIKLITTKKLTPQSSRKQITCMSYSQKQIIKAVKIFLRNSDALGRTLLKTRYPTTILWYAKLALKRRKCFTACDCVGSQTDNLYPIFISHHKNGNLNQKWALYPMICMPERASLTMERQFSMPEAIMQRHMFHPQLQYNLICQSEKRRTRQEPQNSVPHIFSPKGGFMWPNRYVSLHGTWCRNMLGTTD